MRNILDIVYWGVMQDIFTYFESLGVEVELDRLRHICQQPGLVLAVGSKSISTFIDKFANELWVQLFWYFVCTATFQALVVKVQNNRGEPIIIRKGMPYIWSIDYFFMADSHKKFTENFYLRFTSPDEVYTQLKLLDTQIVQLFIDFVDRKNQVYPESHIVLSNVMYDCVKLILPCMKDYEFQPIAPDDDDDDDNDDDDTTSQILENYFQEACDLSVKS